MQTDPSLSSPVYSLRSDSPHQCSEHGPGTTSAGLWVTYNNNPITIASLPPPLLIGVSDDRVKGADCTTPLEAHGGDGDQRWSYVLAQESIDIIDEVRQQVGAAHNKFQWETVRGGGEIEVRNFSQFSAISQFFAIFCNFSQFSAIFRNFSAIFHTSRFSDRLPTLVQNNEIFFFLLFHTLSNVAKSPEPGIAQLVVPLHCSSRVLGSTPVGHNMVTFAFLVFLPSLFWSFSCLHVCMFACACPMCQRLQSNGAYTSVAMLLI